MVKFGATGVRVEGELGEVLGVMPDLPAGSGGKVKSCEYARSSMRMCKDERVRSATEHFASVAKMVEGGYSKGGGG